MEKKKIRMGIIGTGMIFTRHYNGIMASKDAELAAICDSNEEALMKKGAEVGLDSSRLFTDYEEMFDSGLIDAVSICTPNNTHVKMAKAAIKRGIHFAMEKPVGVNYEEVKELNEIVKKSNVKNMICFTYRFKSAARFVRDIIKNGDIGDIYHVYVEYIQDYDLRPFSFSSFWRFEKNVAGGGVVYDLGCHITDLVTFMTGLDYKEICATTDNVIKMRPDPVTKEMREVNTDDYCHMMTKFNTGATGVFIISKCCLGRKNYQRVSIYGTKGAVIYNLTDKNLEDNVEVCIGKPYVDSYKFDIIPTPSEFKADMMQSFFDIVNGCPDGLAAEMDEGLRAQYLMERIVESSEKRTWVDCSQV